MSTIVVDTMRHSMGRRKKRTWSDGEKREICQQTTMPGVSVAQVGRRYAVNANLIFKWLKDPRFVPGIIEAEETTFLPVEICVDVVAPDPPPLSVPMTPRLERNFGPASNKGRIEIELAGGHRISVEGGFDPEALGRLLKGLMA